MQSVPELQDSCRHFSSPLPVVWHCSALPWSAPAPLWEVCGCWQEPHSPRAVGAAPSPQHWARPAGAGDLGDSLGFGKKHQWARAGVDLSPCATSQVWSLPGTVWEIRWAQAVGKEEGRVLPPFPAPHSIYDSHSWCCKGLGCYPYLELTGSHFRSAFSSILIYSCAEIKDCTSNSLNSAGADVNFGLSCSLLCCWSLCAVYLCTSAYLYIIIYESSSSFSWRGWNTGRGQGLFIPYAK